MSQYLVLDKNAEKYKKGSCIEESLNYNWNTMETRLQNEIFKVPERHNEKKNGVAIEECIHGKVHLGQVGVEIVQILLIGKKNRMLWRVMVVTFRMTEKQTSNMTLITG